MLLDLGEQLILPRDEGNIISIGFHDYSREVSSNRTKQWLNSQEKQDAGEGASLRDSSTDAEMIV